MISDNMTMLVVVGFAAVWLAAREVRGVFRDREEQITERERVRSEEARNAAYWTGRLPAAPRPGTGPGTAGPLDGPFTMGEEGGSAR